MLGAEYRVGEGSSPPSPSLLCSDRDEVRIPESRPPFTDAFVGMICSQRQLTLSLERLGKRTLTRRMMVQRCLYVNDGCARLRSVHVWFVGFTMKLISAQVRCVKRSQNAL